MTEAEKLQRAEACRERLGKIRYSQPVVSSEVAYEQYLRSMGSRVPSVPPVKDVRSGTGRRKTAAA